MMYIIKEAVIYGVYTFYSLNPERQTCIIFQQNYQNHPTLSQNSLRFLPIQYQVIAWSLPSIYCFLGMCLCCHGWTNPSIYWEVSIEINCNSKSGMRTYKGGVVDGFTVMHTHRHLCGDKDHCQHKSLPDGL